MCVTGVACVRVQGRGPGPGLGLGAYYYPDPADVLGWIPGIADVVVSYSVEQGAVVASGNRHDGIRVTGTRAVVVNTRAEVGGTPAPRAEWDCYLVGKRNADLDLALRPPL